MVKRNDTYPATFSEAHTLLCRHKDEGSRRPNDNNNGHINVSFMQTGGSRNDNKSRIVVVGTNGITRVNTYCYQCGMYGHISRYCPTATSARSGGVQEMQCQFVNEKESGATMIPHEWLLLDGGSTISSIKNLDLSFNVKDLDTPL